MLTLTQSLFTRNIWTFQKSDELDKAYKEILNEYLGVDIYHKGDWTYEEISTAIKNYFSDNFTYTLEPGVTPKGEDFIDYFLGTQKGGLLFIFRNSGCRAFKNVWLSVKICRGVCGA